LTFLLTNLALASHTIGAINLQNPKFNKIVSTSNLFIYIYLDKKHSLYYSILKQSKHFDIYASKTQLAVQYSNPEVSSQITTTFPKILN
jgi:hypothetical protein